MQQYTLPEARQQAGSNAHTTTTRRGSLPHAAGGRGGPGTATSTMTTTITPPPPRRILTEKYRRNGRLQSCEPCRKSKLRCDHVVVPACGRCVKRGTASQCFYHPSPLTQTHRRTPPSSSSSSRSIPTPDTSPPESSNQQRQQRQHTQEGQGGIYESTETGAYQQQQRQDPDSSSPPVVVGGGGSSSSQAAAGPPGPPPPITTTSGCYHCNNNYNNTHVQCQQQPFFHRAVSAPPLDWQRPARRDFAQGNFQGPTSHLSILSESLGILGHLQQEGERPASSTRAGADRNDNKTKTGGLPFLSSSQDNESSSMMTSGFVVSPERVAQGCQVLAFFRDRHLITQLVGRLYADSEGSGGGLVPEPIMNEWLAQLWAHHGPVLLEDDASNEEQKTRRLSELVFRNTLAPLDFDGATTAGAWARLGSGPGLRWAVLGAVALSVGLCVLETPAGDHLLADNLRVSRACLLGRVQDVADQCLTFCRAGEVLDDLFLWLLMEYACFVESTKGERAYATYRATGETASAVVAMGLHQGICPSDKVPFFLAELRKRALLIAYYQEANIATVLGRPFRLSSRYCILDPPLDLTDSQVVATGPELEAALAGLDENGYNKSGVMHHAGRIRSYLNICKRREDVVDLALGQYTPQEILTRAQAIQELNDHVVDDLPPFIRKAYDGGGDLSHLSAFQVLNSIPLRVARQANEILLQRILIRKTGAGSEKLVRTARAVFQNVLHVTQRHDVAARFQTSYHFLLSGHGLRVAAIVATELFKQEMLPQYPEDPLLPRSQTIQDLAVFAATLGNVDSSAGVHVLCQHGKRVITSILDRILSPPSSRQDPGVVPTSRVEAHAQAPAAGGLASVSVMETDFRQPSTSIGTPVYGMMSLPLPEYAMMDLGIGGEAPTVLGQDSDFMNWLEGMNWETTHNWSM